MLIVDRGVQGFLSWFSETFDPIVSVAVEACSECQPDAAADTATSRTKRAFPFHVVEDAKRRRRTIPEVRRPISTLGVLRQLRQRQMLSTLDNFTSEMHILVSLGAPPTVLDLQRTSLPKESPPRPTTPVRRAMMACAAKFYQQEPICASTAEPEAQSPFPTPSSNTTIPPLPESQYPYAFRLGSPRALPVYSDAPSNHIADTTDDSAKDLEESAVFFICETIEMARRGQLFPPDIPPMICPAPGKVDCRVPSKKQVNGSKKKGKQFEKGKSAKRILLPVRHNLPPRPQTRAQNRFKDRSSKSVSSNGVSTNGVRSSTVH
ncbi:hypothetical protein C8R46DRAFT_1109706 [Mycena filopes]|nr:hypothetical protein C8R46DRAFT_1109706 [Mycena filopes]